MTDTIPLHSAVLAALSKEIADADDSWITPGVSCTNPKTGAAWRFTGALSYGWAPDNNIAYRDMQNDDSLPGAREAGPNLLDTTTVNSLLGADGQVRGPYGVSWIAVIAGHDGSGNDRTIAIGRAWLAARASLRIPKSGYVCDGCGAVEPVGGNAQTNGAHGCDGGQWRWTDVLTVAPEVLK